MNALETILLALVGNTLVLAVLGYVCKTLVERFLARDTKSFESNLKQKVDSEIEKLRNTLLKETESYRLKLKKSEFLFQKEFEAASSFVALFQEIHPGVSDPLMDLHDACDDLALNFSSIEKKLNSFLAKFGAVLLDEERALLLNAISISGYGKFDVDSIEVSSATNAKAEKLLNHLVDLESQLIDRVRGQSSI